MADVEALLTALEADNELEAAIKHALKRKYNQAIEFLKNAETNTATATAFRVSIQSAPGEADDLTELRKALPAAEDAAGEVSIETFDDVQEAVTLRRAELKKQESQLDDAEKEVARIGKRPEDIEAELKQAADDVAKTETELAAPDLANANSADRVADRLVLQSQREALRAKEEMLRQERTSLSVREEREVARRDLLARQVENDRASLNVLEKFASQKQLTAALKLAKRIAASLAEVGSAGGDEAVRKLAAEMQELPQDNIAAVKQLMANATTLMTSLRS